MDFFLGGMFQHAGLSRFEVLLASVIEQVLEDVASLDINQRALKGFPVDFCTFGMVDWVFAVLVLFSSGTAVAAGRHFFKNTWCN